MSKDNFAAMPGYKPFRISTIVDLLQRMQYQMGYKPFRISTIVDSVRATTTTAGLQAFQNFYYCRFKPAELAQGGYKPFRISTIVDSA